MKEEVINVKEQIMLVAKEMFIKFGYEKTNIEEISTQLHKSKRSIYNLFENKCAIYRTVLMQELAENKLELQRIFDHKTNTTPLNRLKKYLLKRMDLLSNSPIYQQVIISELQKNSVVYEMVADILNNFYAWENCELTSIWTPNPTENVAKLQPNATAFADMVQMVMQGLSVTFFVQKKFAAYHDTYDMLVNLIVDSVSSQILTYTKN